MHPKYGGGGKNFTGVRGGGGNGKAKRGADGLAAVGELADGGGGENGGLEGGGRLDKIVKNQLKLCFRFHFERDLLRERTCFLAMDNVEVKVGSIGEGEKKRDESET